MTQSFKLIRLLLLDYLVKKNCNKFTEMMTLTDWDSLYLPETDWYTALISTVKRIYEMAFPLVHGSRSRIKDKPWITKGLKQSIRNNHKLYRLSIRNGDNDSKTKYRKYKNILRTCIKSAEENFYKSLFEDTRTSSYNMWRSLGPAINPGKHKKRASISKMRCDGSFTTND